MNVFDIYLEKIKNLVLELNKNNDILLPDTLDSINVDVTPVNLDFDISTNVSMVIAKINKKSPLGIADILIKYIKKKDEYIENISVAKPGFINIKFNNLFWNNLIEI